MSCIHLLPIIRIQWTFNMWGRVSLVPICNEPSINDLPPSVTDMPLTFRCELEGTSTWRSGGTIQHLWNPPSLEVQQEVWEKNMCQNHAKTRDKTRGKRRKHMEKWRKRMEKRRKHMEKKTNEILPSPPTKDPNVGEFASKGLSGSRNLPRLEAISDKATCQQQMSWRMKLKTVEPRKKTASIWEKITQSTCFDIFFCPSLKLMLQHF